MIFALPVLLFSLLASDPPAVQVHAYVPLEFAAKAEPVNGTITALTNAGLFEIDSTGTIIRQIHPSGENLSGQRFMNVFIPGPDGDFAYIVSNAYNSSTHCIPSSITGDYGGDVYRFDGEELNHVMRHSGNTLVINDPSGEFWIIEYFNVFGYDGMFRLHRLEDEQSTHFPEFTYGKSFWYDEDAEGIVIGYSTITQDALTNYWGNEFKRWNGEEFETIAPPALPPLRNLMASHRWNNQELRKTMAAQLSWLPETEWKSYISTIEEGPDGSVWTVESTLSIVCVTTKNGTSSIANEWYDQMFTYMHHEIWGGNLIRRHSGGAEEHAAWVEESGDFYGISDMTMQVNGAPLLSFHNRLPSGGTTESKPAAWYYEDIDSPLVMLPDGISRRFMRSHYLDKANAGRWFLYSGGTADDSLYLLDEDRLHTIALPDSLVLETAYGIHPAGEDRWRMYALSGAQIDIVLPDGDPLAIPVIDEVLPADQATRGFGVMTEDQTLWYAERGGNITATRNGVQTASFEWSTDKPITSMVYHDEHLWIGTCWDGIVRVNTTSGEQSEIRTVDGLSSNCVLSLSVGPSGRIFVGTSFGYSVIGEPMQPGGVAMAPFTPVSVDEDENGTIPASVQLMPNFPNPFNPATIVPFVLHESGHVRITVYNAVGQAVQVLADRVVTAGHHQVTFNAAGLSSGVYLVQIVHESGQMHTRPVMFVK